MLIRVSGPGRTVITDLPGEVSWGSTAGGSQDSLRFLVPRNSAAWGDEAFDEDGGFVVEAITPHGPLRAIADIPEPAADGLHFVGHDLSHWLSEQVVLQRRSFRSALAGHVVRWVWQQVLAANVRSPIKLGSVLMAPPLVNIDIDGQSVLDVLRALYEQTGHEYDLDDQTLTLSWLPAQGRAHQVWLVDDGTIFERLQQGTLLDRPAEVVEIEPDGNRHHAVDPNTPIYWPRQEVVRL